MRDEKQKGEERTKKRSNRGKRREEHRQIKEKNSIAINVFPCFLQICSFILSLEEWLIKPYFSTIFKSFNQLYL